MKKLLVLAALAGGGVVAGVSPDTAVDAARGVASMVIEESSEIAAEEGFERNLEETLNGRYSLVDDPACDAEVAATESEDVPLSISSLECSVETAEYGAIDVVAQLRGGQPVLALTDSDTGQLIEVISDSLTLGWLPLVPETQP